MFVATMAWLCLHHLKIVHTVTCVVSTWRSLRSGRRQARSDSPNQKAASCLVLLDAKISASVVRSRHKGPDG